MTSQAESALSALPLGVLELSKMSSGSPGESLGGIVSLAQGAEQAGYRRFWVAEHHVRGAAHSCPEIMTAIIAARTSTIRVGPGGVLLRYYSPLKVAETFLALESMFPGRIDLGVAKGPGITESAVAEALVYGNAWELEPHVFDRKVHDLAEILAPPIQGGRSRTGPVVARPDGVPAPPMWLLGSGPSTVSLADRLELPCAVAAFTKTPEDVHRLFENHGRSPAGCSSATALAVSVTVAESDAAASTRDNRLVAAGYLPANFTGTPATVARRIHECFTWSSVEEIILTTFTTDVEERRFTFSSIADAFRAQGLVEQLPLETVG